MNNYGLRSEPVGASGVRLRAATGNRIAAVVAWLVGLAATAAGLAAFLPGAPWYIPAAFAIVSQAFLTWAERAIWRGRPSLVGMGALIIDVLLNAGGIYPYALRLGATPPARMIADVLNATGDIGPIGAMIVSVVLGFLVAAAPEELWSRKD